MNISNHSIRDLAILAEIVAKEGFFDMAREYLAEISTRIDAMEAPTATAQQVEEMKPVTKPLVVVQAQQGEPEPEPGILRDQQTGKVTHISAQPGELGYDPDLHENTELKVYCDGQHVEFAHTANTLEGTVKYYEKDDRGRIKTRIRHGNIEIKGI
jgi:hypothetical protein